MNLSRCFFVWLCLLAWVGMEGVWAQNKDPQQEEINKIKKSADYLSATGNSMKSEEDARSVAYTLLEQNIIYWLKEDQKCADVQGYVAKSKQKFEAIPTRRGKLYRVFLYVKKQDILPIGQEDSLMQVDMNQPELQQTESDQSVALKQNKEQQLAVEAVSLPEKAKHSEVTSESSLSQAAVQADVRSEVVNPVQVEQPATVTVEGHIGTAENGIENHSEERKMLMKAGWGRLKQYVEQLEKAGRLRGFGNGIPQVQSGCVYCFQLDFNQLVVARLKYLNGQWKDIRSGQQVSMDALTQQGVHARWVWITLSE